MDIEKNSFLKEFHFTTKDLEKYNINWNNLLEIYKDFLIQSKQLEIQANYIADVLRKNEKVHTVRSRVKDPKHLIAKLIRKTPERQEAKGDEFQFNIENYLSEITDVIGVRAIHIFKEDWEIIHNYIKETWNTFEEVANIRTGDEEKRYEDLSVEVNPRKTGYRSVHYLIRFSPTLKEVTAEIQVRTIFEEGYGEIDHQLRYPHNNVPEALQINLLMLNRLAGSADEMSSFINVLKDQWNEMEETYKEIIENKNKELDDLKIKVEKMNIDESEKISLVKDIGEIEIKPEYIELFDLSRKFSEVIPKIDWEGQILPRYNVIDGRLLTLKPQLKIKE